MKKGFMVLFGIVAVLVVISIAAGAAFFIGRQTVINKTVDNTSTQTIVGGDSDEHGCKASAGYSWCEAKGKCLRPWEEKCEGGVATPESTKTVASPKTTPDETATLIAAMRAQIQTKSGYDQSSMNYSVSKIEGNYAKGMASSTGGGGLWFAAKVNGSWKLVFDGNGIIQCSDLTNYPSFPNTLIPECWDTAGSKLVKR